MAETKGETKGELIDCKFVQTGVPDEDGNLYCALCSKELKGEHHPLRLVSFASSPRPSSPLPARRSPTHSVPDGLLPPYFS